MPESTHRSVLMGAFSPQVVDALDGHIRELAREEIEQAVQDIKSEVRQLVSVQERQIDDARALPPEQRRAVEPAVNAGTGQVQAVARDANDLDARRRAGEEIDPREVDQVRQRSDQARQQQADTDTRLATARRLREEQEAEAARQQEQARVERERQAATPLADDDLVGRLGRVERRLDEHETVMMSSFLTGRRIQRGSGAGQKALDIMVGAFVLLFLLYCLIVLIMPVEWDWSNALGVPAIFAALTAAVVWQMNSRSSQDDEVMTYDRALVISQAEQDQRAARQREAEPERLRIMEERERHEHDEERSSSSSNPIKRVAARVRS